ncbi:hypothetical protein AN643_03070 [Candidatus Epulonipiscioides saccharophilum]|nr:hypothetical protein AN643_03070 [Epulopiscium sp. SCG-B10WGA-EpuloB]
MKTLKDFNIFPSVTKIQTEAVQDAINRTSLDNEVLLFNSGLYITGLLEMQDNTNIEFESGTVIIGSSDLDDYSGVSELFVDAVGSERGRCLLYAHNKQNIRLSGSCTIDGRMHKFTPNFKDFQKRPFLLNFINCNNIILEGICFKNSPAWMLCLSKCSDIKIEDITILNRSGKNNDGIDINSSKNVIIKNSIIDSGDDAICIKSTYNQPSENILVEECVICSDWSAFKIGTESMGDIRNINVKNCFIHDTKGCAIKILSADGANISNVKIEDITLLDATGPIFITNGNRLKSYYEPNPNSKPGKISNIEIKNLFGNINTAIKNGTTKELFKYPAVIAMTGMEDCHLENISLSNFDLIFEGGEFTPAEKIEEIGNKYPEFNRLGILPASKIFAMNIDNLEMKNIKIELANKSSLKEIVLKNVE